MEGFVRSAFERLLPQYLLESSIIDKPPTTTFLAVNRAEETQLANSGRALRYAISSFPQCASSCILGHIVDLKCTHSDYVCFCEGLHIISKPCDAASSKKLMNMKICLDGCKSFDQWYSLSMLLEICEAVDVKVVLPGFMRESLRIHQRQVFSSGFLGSSLAPAPTIPAPAPTIPAPGPTVLPAPGPTEPAPNEPAPRVTTTFTEYEPFGGSEWSTTTTNDGNGFVTVIILTPTPSLPSTSTLSFTATSSSDRTTSISSFPTTSQDPNAKISTSLTSTSTTSSATGTNAAGTGSGSGMAMGAKIGIGVAIPLILILLAVGWFLLRRKKKRAAAEAALDDGGITGIAELEHNIQPGSGYKHEIVGEIQELNSAPNEMAVGGIGKTYEMSNDTVDGGNVKSKTVHELNNNEQTQPSVMSSGYGIQTHDRSAATRKHESEGAHSPPDELPDAPRSPQPQIERKPLSSQSTFPISPPPWENDHEAEYMGTRPKEIASFTPHEAGSSSGNIDFVAVEEEMARIKAQKERLTAIQALDEREEQLRKILEAKK